jgi:ABC-type transport system involved in cytochrome c biogenesis permease subunit
VAVIGVLVTATVLEKIYGTPFVMEHIYGAWWFISLWGLLGVSLLHPLLKEGRKSVLLGKDLGKALLHFSFVIILIGALVTHLYGVQGSIHLRKGEPTTMMINRETQLVEHLPFTITLKDFELRTYPGTQSPMDYVSVFTTSSGEELSVSMNKIGECQSYRFYQSGYDPDLQGTYLSVSHDPWGIGITYTGYALLILSMILILLPNPLKVRGNWWQKLRFPFLFLFFSLPLGGVGGGHSTLHATPKVLPADVAADFSNLYTYYNGRICPFQTMAIDFTTKLYGKSTYQGLSAEQVVTGWMLFPSTWVDQPFIKIKGQTVHELLKTDETYVCYDDFFDKGQYRLDDVLYQLHTGAQLPDARAVTEVDEKMNLLLMLWNGQLLKLYPADGKWYSREDNLPETLPHDQWFFIKHSMDYVGELAVQQDYQELTATLQKIRQYQQKTMGEDNLPSDFQFKAEKLYNSLNYIKLLAILLLTIGIIAYIIGIFCDIRKRTMPRWFRILLMIVSVVSLIYLLLFITLRTIVSGHLPLTNGFEVMLFMSACSLAMASLKRLEKRTSIFLTIAGLTSLVATMGQSNPQITPLMPVLSSPLLSIHVCLVMLSYTLFAFLALNSLAALVTRQNYQLSTINYQLKLAVSLLAAGIILGAIWANQSWGRYWGWDPKEVWALITLMVYAIPLHFTPKEVRGERLEERTSFYKSPLKGVRGSVFFHIYLVFAFLTVIITYFGVNFFLGGMHSYANG